MNKKILRNLLEQWIPSSILRQILEKSNLGDELLNMLGGCEWDENKIIFKQIEHLLDHNIEPWHHLTSGMQWKIYVTTVFTKEWAKKVLVIKKQEWNSYRNEFDCHIKAIDLFHNNKTIWVPQLYGSKSYVKKNEHGRPYEESYIVMEYIEWKTIYCCLIEKLVEKWYLQHKVFFDETSFMVRYQNDIIDHNKLNSRSIFNFSNDALAGSAFFEALEIMNKNSELNWMSQNFMRHILIAKPYQIIMGIIEDTQNLFLFEKGDKSFMNQVIKSIKEMNKNDLYHRDLWKNNRNLILWDDNKMYIIDFGIATRVWSWDPFNIESNDGWKKTVTRYQNDIAATRQELFKYIYSW